MTAFLASVFVFLAIITGALGFLRTTRRGTPADQRLRQLATPFAAEEDPTGSATLRRSRSSIPFLRHALAASDWAQKTEDDLRQASISLRVGEYLILRVGFAAVLFVGTLFISRMHPAGIVIALVLGPAGYLLPSVFVKMARRRRIEKIEQQLVELAPMLASALRSGFALQQGMELASRQLEAPIAEELGQLINDVNLGATMESALLDMGRRCGSPDLDMLITAILIQRTSGGKLSEVLEQTAETLRERERIRGDVKTFTAQQRLTGLILSVYPAAIGLLLLALMPSMWSLMFTEPVGQTMLGIALGLQAIGFVAIRRVMDIQI
jgi:tight adherence protein B